MLFEDTFYEDGQDIAERIHAEVAACLKQKGGADLVANIAFEARTKFKLRHAPLWLAVALARANTPESRALMSGVLRHVIQRADELGEFVAMFWKANGKRVMLPHQVKIGLGAALQKFDDYKVTKYANRDAAVKLRDVLFLIHAKPKDEEQAALWKRLAEKQTTAPDTWERNLSAGEDKGETFTRLLTEDKMGAMALLRNLRNMQQAKVPEHLIRQALAKMKVGRVLPFRFITAAKYAPTLEPYLEGAMFTALEGMAKWPGKTALILDHSDSMHAAISGKSELLRADAAAALAILMREVCEDVAVYAYSGTWYGHSGPTVELLPPRRGFALRDRYMDSTVGWGNTDTGQAVIRANMDGYDRIVVITDEQSSTKVPDPLPEAKAYFVNVAAYQHGIGYGKWTHIDGWSEAAVQYIAQAEGIQFEDEEKEPE
jgi:hypothetical protein